jgi:hypothetical protein
MMETFAWMIHRIGQLADFVFGGPGQSGRA